MIFRNIGHLSNYDVTTRKNVSSLSPLCEPQMQQNLRFSQRWFWEGQFLEYSTVKFVKSQLTYRRNTSPPSSGSRNKPSKKSVWRSFATYPPKHQFTFNGYTALYPPEHQHFKYFPGSCLEGLRKSTKRLIQDSWCPDREEGRQY
jgi:hypothetical protein